MTMTQQRRNLLFLRVVALSIVIVLCLNYAAALSSSATRGRTSVAQCLLDRVRNNNKGADASTVPFLVGNQHMGNVLPQAVQAFSQYPSVFSVTKEGLQLVDHIDWGTSAVPASKLVDLRSQAVNDVLLDLRHKNIIPALQGWRDERFAVRESFHAPPALFVERAAAVLFGVPAYGVFLNGYTVETYRGLDEDDDEGYATTSVSRRRPTHIWVGRRSSSKATWPGRLDSLAAGGLSAGMLPLQAMVQECAEEAGIDKFLPQAASAVSYTGFNEDGWGLKRDVLFCFDLELPPDFEPTPVDGEMDSFEKVPVNTILDMLAMSVLPDDSNNCWKPNVGVVLIDFLVRHGFVDVNDPAFLELIGALRGARCA